MMIYRDERLDSVLIGRIERTQISLRVGYLKLFRPTARVLCITQGGFLGNQCLENSRLAIHEIVKSLRCGDADLARLDYVRIDSPLFGAAKDVPGVFCQDHFASKHPHGCVKLPGSYDEFVGGLSRKDRHNLNRYAKKLRADFSETIRIEFFRNESQVECLIQDAETIATKSYQRGLGVGFQDNLEMRECLRNAAERGGLRGCILYLENRPCAFMIGVQYGRTLHGTAMGYDPQYTEYAPGSLLLMHWIRDAFETSGSERVYEIDLGPGEGRHKRAVYNHMWTESLVYVFAPTLKGLLINSQRTLAHFIDQFARHLLLKTQIFDKLKKFWRSRTLDESQRSARRPNPRPQMTSRPAYSIDANQESGVLTR